MTFDAQRPVIADGHLSAGGASFRAGLGGGRDSFASAADASGPGRIRPLACPGPQKRMTSAAGENVLQWVGAVQ